MATQNLESAIKAALDAITDARYPKIDNKTPEYQKKAINSAKKKEKTLNKTIASKWNTILTENLPFSSDFIKNLVTALADNGDFIKTLKSKMSGG